MRRAEQEDDNFDRYHIFPPKSKKKKDLKSGNYSQFHFLSIIIEIPPQTTVASNPSHTERAQRERESGSSGNALNPIFFPLSLYLSLAD